MEILFSFKYCFCYIGRRTYVVGKNPKDKLCIFVRLAVAYTRLRTMTKIVGPIFLFKKIEVKVC